MSSTDELPTTTTAAPTIPMLAGLTMALGWARWEEWATRVGDAGAGAA